jgi:hypothetical protein
MLSHNLLKQFLSSEYAQINTIIALTPDLSGLDVVKVQSREVTSGFPALNEELYSTPRDVPG